MGQWRAFWDTVWSLRLKGTPGEAASGAENVDIVYTFFFMQASCDCSISIYSTDILFIRKLRVMVLLVSIIYSTNILFIRKYS